MIRRTGRTAAILLLAGGTTAMLGAGVARATSVPSAAVDAVHTPLYARMLRANASLRSYQSRVHVEIAMHSFPYLSPTLEGTVYYKAPDKNAIVFDDVPALASLFKKVYPRLDPPATWPALYQLRITGDDGKRTTFRLDPKKYGTIDHLNVDIDDAEAVPVGFTYFYRNGGTVHFDQTVESLKGVYVIKALNGHVSLPSTSADVSSSFNGYQINVPIKDDVFSEGSS